MAKTFSRHIVNGEEFLVRDEQARQVLNGIANVPVTWIQGKYIDENGNYISYVNSNATDKIPIMDPAGINKRNIYIKVKINSAAYIAYYDKNGTLISTETTQETGDVVFETETKNTQEAYFVAITNLTGFTPIIMEGVYDSNIGQIYDVIPNKNNLYDPNDSRIQEGKFIDWNRVMSLDGFAITHPIPVKAGISYTYTQPAAGIGNTTQYAVCDAFGNVKAFRTDKQIINDTITFTETESCYVLLNIPLNTVGRKWFKICETSIFNSNYTPYTGKLVGKKILYNGDSIAESRKGGGYPELIKNITGGTYENRAVGGGTLAVKADRHNVCTDIENMSSTGDLICLEGGINDYWGNIPLGDFSESDFTGTVDNTTVCGALESILRQAINKWPGKPIVFVIVHKITDTAWARNSAGYNFAEEREKMIGICEKYSIPYLDMWAAGGLNAYMEVLNEGYLNGGASVHPDGCHPDVNGYKKYYVPRLIALFESLIPFDD